MKCIRYPTLVLIIIIIRIYYAPLSRCSAAPYNITMSPYIITRATKQISFQVATEISVCMNVPDVSWK